jgi:hypothetical protein
MKSIELQPEKNEFAYERLAVLHYITEEYESYWNTLEKLTANDGSLEDVYYRISLYYLKTTDVARRDVWTALEYAFDAYDLSTSNRIQLLIARIFYAQGKKRDAVNMIRQILTFYPDYEDAEDLLKEIRN